MTQPDKTKPFNSLSLLAVMALGLIGLYFVASPTGKVETSQTTAVTSSLKSLAVGPMAGVVLHAAPKPLPEITFTDAAGQPKKLADWKGKTVLLNLWATWCTPCKEEMPALSNLQKAAGGPDFEVLALSLDRKGAEASGAFLREVKADNLATYVEPEGKSLAALQALGLPATILINKKGEEVGRLLGPAAWDSPEAVALIKAVIAQN
jgi:thiol-disulfide isomerase/thioredoxin